MLLFMPWQLKVRGEPQSNKAAGRTEFENELQTTGKGTQCDINIKYSVREV